jgi:TPP-dependent 2-oxoacid decarboxylase
MHTTISEYLLKRLTELGIQHIFGVPGDYNLALLDKVIEFSELSWVGTCNELNAAYATDGYARVKGAGALITTFGVGELSAINGIAGAFAEYVPIVNIVGLPATHTIEQKSLVHHTLGDGRFHVFIDMYKYITQLHTILNQDHAAYEIDRLLVECWRKKRPVYIGLPSDLVNAKIEAIARPLDLRYPLSNPDAVNECATRITKIIQEAKSPVILADLCADRHPMKKGLETLLTNTKIPFATMNMAKGLVNESHPQFIGNYCGAFSTPGVQEIVESSDCVITFGSLFTDFNTGGFSAKLNANTSIEIHSLYTRVKQSFYQDVIFRDIIAALTNTLAGYTCPQKISLAAPKQATDKTGKLTQNIFWQRIGESLVEEAIVLAETGTSLFGALHMLLPDGTKFISQTLWGSIGYALGALLGAKIAAPDRQVVLFIGDGSFQLTAQEVSTLQRHQLNPIIFLLNNGGYTIERLIRGADMPYNDIAKWHYTEYPKAFAGDVVTLKVTDIDQLEKVIQQAKTGELNRNGLALIEVMFEKMDAPQILVNLGKAMDDLNRGIQPR